MKKKGKRKVQPKEADKEDEVLSAAAVEELKKAAEIEKAVKGTDFDKLLRQRQQSSKQIQHRWDLYLLPFLVIAASVLYQIYGPEPVDEPVVMRGTDPSAAATDDDELSAFEKSLADQYDEDEAKEPTQFSVEKNPDAESAALEVFRFVCEDERSYCHPDLQVIGRSVHVKTDVAPKTPLVKISPALQLYDMDALRDKTIQSLFKARMGSQKQSLYTGAFMASYLALYVDDAVKRKQNPVLDQFYNSLPSSEGEGPYDYHPATWPQDSKRYLSLRHKAPQTFVQLGSVRTLIETEYEALQQVNYRLMTELVGGFERYRNMRLAVSTRGFGNIVHPKKEGQGEIALIQEVEHYIQQIGSPQLRTSPSVLVLLADMLNSHSQFNVEYIRTDHAHHSPNLMVYTAHQNKSIPAGSELFSSYAVSTENELFTRYGFVQGDGLSSASLAVYHQYASKKQDEEEEDLNPEQKLKKLKKQMLPYLLFDDGSEECITQETHSKDELKLKRRKLRALMSISKTSTHWTIEAKKKNSAISHKLFQTCRIIVLKPEDYDGKALEKLADANSFLRMTHSDSDNMRYRELSCLYRLSKIAQNRLKAARDELIDDEQIDYLSQSELSTVELFSETVEKLRNELYTPSTSVGTKMVGALRKNLLDEQPDFPTPRRKPCPIKHSLFLLEK